MRGAYGDRLPALQARPEPGREHLHPARVPARLQRHHQRLQGLPARGHRDGAAAALEPLQPHRRAAAQGDRARAQLRRDPDLLDEPRRGRLEAQAAGDGQPLPVHRALRVPRAPPEPRRLPARRTAPSGGCGRASRDTPAARAAGRASRAERDARHTPRTRPAGRLRLRAPSRSATGASTTASTSPTRPGTSRCPTASCSAASPTSTS